MSKPQAISPTSPLADAINQSMKTGQQWVKVMVGGMIFDIAIQCTGVNGKGIYPKKD